MNTRSHPSPAEAPGVTATLAVADYVYAAASSFCLVVYAFSLARLNAVWFDPRFALVALGVCASGMAFGAALSATRPVRHTAPAWFAASGLFAAIALAALALLTFGPAYSYLLATVLLALPFTAWVMGISGLVRTWSVETLVRGGTAVAFGVAGAAVASYWSFDLPSGSFLIAGLAAAGLGAASILVTSRWGTASLLLTLCLLGVLSAANNWQPSPPMRWEERALSPLRKEVSATGTDSVSVWTPFSRIEVTRSASAGNDLSIRVNGIFRGLIPLGRPSTDDQASLEKRFPILALPLLAANPRKILLANPHGGIELRMALDRQIAEIHVFEQRDNARALALARPYAGDLLAQNGPVLRHAANTPPWRPADLDQIYLTIPQQHAAGWTDLDPGQNFLFTTEAFREHWGRLKPGGTLVVLAGDQTLFVRALLQAWEALPRTFREQRPIAAQSWGYRALAARSEQRPYEHLAIIAKGRVTPDLANRFTALAKEMPLVPLFGPGIAPGAVYRALAHPAGTAVALPALGQHLVRQQNLLVDIFPATNDRPFFFQPVRDLHPYLKWLVGIGLIALSYVFLVPLAPLRRFDNPQNADRPPIPLYLAVFALAAAGGTGGITATLWQGTRYADLSVLLVTTTTGLVLGLTAGLGVDVRWRRAADAAIWRRAATALAGVVALTGVFAVFAAPRWAQPAPGTYVALATLLAFTGAAFAMPAVLAGIRYCGALIPGVSPWAWVVIGSGALLGPVQALWIAQLQGWRSAWLAQVGMVAAGAAMSLLLSRPARRAKAGADRSRARR